MIDEKENTAGVRIAAAYRFLVQLFRESRPMKISLFAARARVLLVAFGLAMAACLGAGHASAADSAKPLDPKAIAAGMAAAPSVVTAAKVNCDVVNAFLVGPTDTTDAAGKKVKGNIYEIACKAGPGFIVTQISATETHDPFTCNQLTKIKLTHPDSIVCQLPENIPDYKWLQPVVQPFLPGCEVSGARLIGSTTSGALIDRYEVQCKDDVGGLIDYPQIGQTGSTDFKPCLVEEGTTSACTLTTHDQIIKKLTPLAAQADKDCQVNNVRWVGITKDSDGYFYEFGCSNKPGFIVLTGLDNSYQHIVTCATAAGLGGCKFTDTGAVAADAKSGYSKQLGDAGYPCTVTDYDVKGTQPDTKRDYIEFKCPEQPWGLLGYIPQPDSTSALHVTDCFMDAIHKTPYCTYVTPDDLKKQWDKLIKLAKPTAACDVTEVRYIGESDNVDGGVVAELACSNKRGYIAVIASDRQSLVNAQTCGSAKTNNEENQCEIPGNGVIATEQ